MLTGPTRVAVVVPAHDEEELLPGCLAALSVAAAALPDVPVEIVVVLDACTDGTAAICAAAGVRAVTLRARNVGVARAAGAAAAIGDDPAGLWLATTDADSRVPADWLVHQARLAAAGADLVAGTVRVADWAPWPAELKLAYEAGYAAGDRHVHGANLGISAVAYRRVGGFPALALAEDRELVRIATEAGLRVVYSVDTPTLTSARGTARAAGGFSAHLTRLAANL
ncbi:glycosyltransferase [Plantactinospora siamensis]|uniref:4,4'-diaponeurosporenoate glycosyltransferase n=1 Tax=Plantactinospora siamensis TaxID=555372 RepID=A0ABV6P5Y2_9ACTN